MNKYHVKISALPQPTRNTLAAGAAQLKKELKFFQGTSDLSDYYYVEDPILKGAGHDANGKICIRDTGRER